MRARRGDLDMLMETIAVGRRRGERWDVRPAQVAGVAVDMTAAERAEHGRFILCPVTGGEHVFDCPCSSASGESRCGCGKNYCACGEWIFDDKDTEHVRWGFRFITVTVLVAVVVTVGLVIVAVTL